LLNRAYLDIQPTEIRNARNEVGYIPFLHLALTVTNLGRVPTRLKSITHQWGFDGHSSDAEMEESHSADIAPGASFPIQFTVGELPRPQADAWASNALGIRIWGFIVFADYFKQDRVARFAWRFHGGRTIATRGWSLIDHPGLNKNEWDDEVN
jgi:hypothetical protein